MSTHNNVFYGKRVKGYLGILLKLPGDQMVSASDFRLQGPGFESR